MTVTNERHRDEPCGVLWARERDERCEHAISEKLRCMLVKGHDGLHAWRGEIGERTFEWG